MIPRRKGVVFPSTQRQLYSPLGELYCFAVICGFRRVIFAVRVKLANRISLQGKALKYHFCGSKNITLTKSAYHSKLSKKRTYSLLEVVVKYKSPAEISAGGVLHYFVVVFDIGLKSKF